MTLQRPPLVENLLFENPWPLIGVLVFMAAVIAITNRHRPTRQPLIIAGCLVAGAVGLWIMASLVTTERQRLERATHALIENIQQGPIERLTAMLDDQVELVGPHGESWEQSAASFVRQVEQFRILYPNSSHTVRAVEAEHTAGRGRTLLSVRSSIPGISSSINTRWLLTWRPDAAGNWRITEAQFLQIGQQTPTRDILPR